MTSNNNSTSQGKSHGKFTVIVAVIAALALLGLLLSRLDGRIAIVASDVPTPIEPTNTAVIAVSQPTAVIEAPPTLAPQAQGEWLENCENDICIISSEGNRTPLGLTTEHQIYPGFGFSPDGSKIVFSACLKTELEENPAYEFCHELFIADRNGNVSRLTNTYNLPEGYPSWSPDGEWIVFGGWSLSIIRPDGTGMTTLASDPAIGNAYSSAWSPNSAEIAFISGDYDFNINWGFLNEVSIINKDGSSWRKIFELPDPKPIQEDWITEIAWSPDGQSLAIVFKNGNAYLIDARCEAGKEGCRLSDLTAIPEIPQNWLNTFYPQWDGASHNTFTSTLSPQAKQARAFAEPILTAIADRPPDFEDDFSAPNSRWYWTMSNDKGETMLRGNVSAEHLINGTLTLTAEDDLYSSIGIDDCHTMTNFVMQAELVDVDSVSGGEIATHWRVQPNADHYRFTIWLNLIPSWEAAHWVAGIRTPLASGTEQLNERGTPNRVLIVAYDSQFAIYLNGYPLTYFEDDQLTDGKIGTCNFGFGPGPMTIAIDNVKAWNLDNVPGVP